MKVRRIDKITDEKWLNLYVAQYDHNGHAGRWVYASRKPQPAADRRPDAVVVVPILHTDGQPPRLVLVREYRVPVDGYSYGLPAGLLESGEAVEDAVRREIKEETGFDVVRIRHISPPVYSSTGLTDESVRMVYADVRPDGDSLQQLEGLEDIEVLLLDFDAVCRVCNAPDLPIDAKAWGALYMYRLLGSLPGVPQ